VRGSPFFRSVLTFGLLLAVAPLVWRLTHAQERAAKPVAERVPEVSTIRLRLTFSHLPDSLRLLHLGKEVWSALPRTLELERSLSLSYPPEGVDLEFQLQWPENTPCAMRVRLTDPSGREHERTLWGEGKTSDVLTFP
jgi:hypothetical protein